MVQHTMARLIKQLPFTVEEITLRASKGAWIYTLRGRDDGTFFLMGKIKDVPLPTEAPAVKALILLQRAEHPQIWYPMAEVRLYSGAIKIN